MSSENTLLHALSRHAAERPDSIAYSFLRDDNRGTEHVTFRALDREARFIGASLALLASPGSRAVLIYPPGLDFIRAFLGCLAAQVIAVPVPAFRSLHRSSRLDLILENCDATVILTTQAHYDSLPETLCAKYQNLRWVFTDDLLTGPGTVSHGDRPLPGFREPGDGIAFLQYTSGSTSAPKGVIVSHNNLTANQEMIRTAFRSSADSTVLSWLPHHHDMGLIGGILHPLWVGARCLLMSPDSFVRHPMSWLKAISENKATISGGPNFAYDLCAEKITTAQKEELDLSCWSVAFNGADRIRPHTITRFVDTFKKCGLADRALTPCYGLAEATLFVSAKRAGEAYTTYSLARAGSGTGLRPGEAAQTAIGCGQVSDGLIVEIVSPETGMRLQPEQVGEILVSGRSVAQGYWQNPSATKETFHASIPGSPHHFLRTGDLGYLVGQELIVTGRVKDLIILNGINHHPEDIEAQAIQAHPALTAAAGAAFSIEYDSHRLVILVQEIPRGFGDQAGLPSLAKEIRSRVADMQEILLDRVVMVRPASIPRTTSGKVKRLACRDLYQAGSLPLLCEYKPEEPCSANLDNPGSLTQQNEDLLTRIHSAAALALGRQTQEVGTEVSLFALGFDSLSSAHFQVALASKLGIQVPLQSIMRGLSLRELAATAMLDVPTVEAQEDTLDCPAEYPLSPGQQALAYLQLLFPDDSSYNLFHASRCTSGFNVGILETAFKLLIQRHPLLRSVVADNSGVTAWSLLPEHGSFLQVSDGSEWNDATLNSYLEQTANEPFAPTANPPFRARVVQQGEKGDVLLLVCHHIIADLWSSSILLEELAIVYTSLLNNCPLKLPPAPAPYAAFARHQHLFLRSDQSQTELAYWKKALAGAPASLQLGSDRVESRPRANGGSLWLEVDRDLLEHIRTRAKAGGVSLYTFLLAAFQALLLRISGQDDLLVGSPMAGRDTSANERTVGYFVNQVAMRARWRPESTFAEFLAVTHEKVVGALSNQHYPFPALIEQLGAERYTHRHPLTQVMFGLQTISPAFNNDLSAFAMGCEGAAFDRNGLCLHAVFVPRRFTAYDLSLLMAEDRGHLAGLLQYDVGQFEHSSIERIARQFIVLLRAVAADPSLQMRALPLFDQRTAHRLLVEWNDTVSHADLHTAPRMIEDQARMFGSRPAVVADNGTLTYRELSHRSTEAAYLLQPYVAPSNTTVALHCTRSLHLTVGLLGILKSGAAFVPVAESLPPERIKRILSAAQVETAVTDSEETYQSARSAGVANILRLDRLVFQTTSEDERRATATRAIELDSLAYVIFTSGSTGAPKGVMVTHRNLANLLHAMNAKLTCDPGDRFYALTSISFDISILELLWPLTHGAEVALVADRVSRKSSLLATESRVKTAIDFSLFYFADTPLPRLSNPYELLLRGARFADENHFAAVWTPERHFHPFGGLYPNPSVTGAALAVSTRNVRIRAGSVVLPLHNPVRVAEEWAVVDNLSNGRVDIAFASGWHADDFVLAPGNFHDRREVMTRGVAIVRKLWNGHPLKTRNGNNQEVTVEIFPKPIQPELPVWITASGTPETFELAGSLGANVLTHLLGQSLEDVAKNITQYREARDRFGFDPMQGKVALMLHAYLGRDVAQVKKDVNAPFKQYLRSSVGLIEKFIQTMKLDVDLSLLNAEDTDALLDFAVQRYFGTSALFGTVESCESLVEKAIDIGVNEIACLIDFGVETEAALTSLGYVRELMDRFKQRDTEISVPHHIDRKKKSFLQCTPSMMKLLLAEDDRQSPLFSIDTLLLGGEPLTASLVSAISSKLNCRIINVYGPTETTIWSTAHEVTEAVDPVSVGRPLANTQCYILDRRGLPVDIGVTGELYIGGDGVTPGYIGSPELTADRFVRAAFWPCEGSILYRTGDLARFREDGAIEVLGRTDFQIKLLGHRIEPLEIEATLSLHPDVQDVVVVKAAQSSEELLVAYFTSAARGRYPDVANLRTFLSSRLPAYMVPSHFVRIESMPILPSGKTDRRALELRQLERQRETTLFVASPVDQTFELIIREIWAEVLRKTRFELDDNFFDLGGHSLLMVQVHNALMRRLGREFPLIKLLQNPTIRSLASFLSTQSVPNPVGHDDSVSDRANLQRKSFENLRKSAARTKVTAS